jgi:hypothetical protein
MEAACCFEPQVHFQRITPRYVPESLYSPLGSFQRNFNKNSACFSCFLMFRAFWDLQFDRPFTPSPCTCKNAYYCPVQFLTNSLLLFMLSICLASEKARVGRCLRGLAAHNRPTGCMPKLVLVKKSSHVPQTSLANEYCSRIYVFPCVHCSVLIGIHSVYLPLLRWDAQWNCPSQN